MNYKKIGLLLVAVSVLLNGYFLKDYLFNKAQIKKVDGEVRVRMELCAADYEIIQIHTFIEKNKKVFVKRQVVENGKVGEVFDISELNDCAIVDNQNWSCGGKMEVYGTKVTQSPKYLLNNGKFFFSEGVSIVEKDCHPFRFKQLN